jgi:DNA-binding helix-hairpin-helix protein with protein kinase domain
MPARNARVQVENVGMVTVLDLLGRGGQGEVYEVAADTGQRYALKWYTSWPGGLWEALEYLIERGSPSHHFLWPVGRAVSPGEHGFGYLMALRPPAYRGLAELVFGDRDDHSPLDVSFRSTVNLAFHLSRALLRLHALGLCYRDINFGNVFFRPDNGDVLVCDNDNVGIDGTPSTIAGTLQFMAPEVVRMLHRVGGTEPAWPSARTDRHSLAVAQFYILCGSDPLEGTKTRHGPFDADWELEHYGLRPLFVFEPDDDSNRPMSDVTTAYWQLYPSFVRALFLRSFGPGLHDPDARVLESEWATAMLALRDTAARCASCSQTFFVDPAAPDRPCARCGAPTSGPLVMAIGRRRVVISPDQLLFTDHLGGDPDLGSPVGIVVPHPTEHHRVALRNLTETSWTATTEAGDVHDVPPGRAVETLPGLRIHFGPTTGVVER